MPSTSSVPSSSILWPRWCASASGAIISAWRATPFASSADSRSGSRRPPNGSIFHAVLPSNALTCVRPCSDTSVRTPSFDIAIAIVASTLKSPPPKWTLPVSRSDDSAVSLSPPWAAAFFATMSSSEGPASAGEATASVTRTQVQMAERMVAEYRAASDSVHYPTP